MYDGTMLPPTHPTPPVHAMHQSMPWSRLFALATAARTDAVAATLRRAEAAVATPKQAPRPRQASAHWAGSRVGGARLYGT